MNRPLDVLKNVRIAAPCSQPWHEMDGDDRVRFCRECNLNVYNLSDMTAKEAAALVEKTQGRLCIGYYMRADGTILTQNCPVGLRRIRKRMAWAVTGVAAVLGMALNALATLRGDSSVHYSTLRTVKPFKQIANFIDPPAARPMVLGAVALPQPKAQQILTRRGS